MNICYLGVEGGVWGTDGDSLEESGEECTVVFALMLRNLLVSVCVEGVGGLHPPH
jgi:hypothetical protein